MAPDLEGPRWYNRLADTAFVRRLLPEALTRSNDEMMPLQRELCRLDQAWPQLKRPIIAIQGEDDDLVDPRTVDYLERRIDPALLKVQRVPGFGHFVVWERMDLVFEGIQALAR
jgi:pimeloyl-ACP methyl ester carboxylesterase